MLPFTAFPVHHISPHTAVLQFNSLSHAFETIMPFLHLTAWKIGFYRHRIWIFELFLRVIDSYYLFAWSTRYSPLSISAISGSGTGELLDLVCSQLEKIEVYVSFAMGKDAGSFLFIKYFYFLVQLVEQPICLYLTYFSLSATSL